MKSLHRVPTPMTTSASAASALAAVVPVDPIAPICLRVPVRQRALARLALPHRYAGLLAQRPQRLLGAGVVHAASGDDERPLRRPDDGGGVGDVDGLRQRTSHAPRARREELDRPVVGLGLHVLRQRDGHGAGLDRVGEHPHRRDQRRRQLLGPAHPVEEARERAERVVDRHVGGIRRLELLEHRRRHARREGAGRQQQHRDPVDRRESGTGEHVGGARADRGGAHPRLQAVLLAGVGDRGVDHRLLVAGEDVGEVSSPSASSFCSSAWPIPATLPWPKMPKQPAKSFCRSPSRSLHWLARKRTTAWATVSRTIPVVSGCWVALVTEHLQRGVGGRPAGSPRCRAPSRGPGRRR